MPNQYRKIQLLICGLQFEFMQRLRVDFFSNQAPHYRAALWERLLNDDMLDVRFHFGEGATNTIRSIDLAETRWYGKETRFHLIRNVYVRQLLVWQRGVLGQIRKTDARVLVLLGQMYILSMWLAVWIARRRGMAVLFWGHGAYGREGPLKRWFRNRFLRLADGVLVYGEHARRLLIADGFPPERVRVVYNSLDHARQLAIRDAVVQPDFIAGQGWFVTADVPTLLFIGRLTAQKRLDQLIDAVARLRDQGRIFNLLIVGSGPESKPLRALAGALAGQVHFYGACYNEEELGRLIANADLCVSPGEVGLTAMHALGYGTPVCTHNDLTRQMPEAEAIVEGRTGVLFDHRTMDIAGAIRRWFESGQDRAVIRAFCYQEIDLNWNTENQARRIRDAIEELGAQSG